MAVLWAGYNVAVAFVPSLRLGSLRTRAMALSALANFSFVEGAWTDGGTFSGAHVRP